MKLNDFFPESLKEDYPETGIDIGTVIRLHVKDTKPPKEKRFIVVGITEDRLSLATVYINSEINEKVNWAQQLKEQHLFLEAEGRNYLNWDSYVDCSKLVPRDFAEIENAVKAKPEAVLGKISDKDLGVIKQKICQSPTIKGKHKNKFGFYK